MASQDIAELEGDPGVPMPLSSHDAGASDNKEPTFDVYDGRVDIELDSRLGRTLSTLLREPAEIDHSRTESSSDAYDDVAWDIPLNIVIQVVGSRGDVQPFVALGSELQRWGHRVRLATHNVFEKFVQDAGLEFYPIGGDPAQLMAYMVKNPGLIPGMKTLREGEIKQKRAMIAGMLDGCWKSCIEPEPHSGVPFVAQAIIANPVSFAHLHCAQVLSIPVHLMFTMPWTSTRAFPHPLANIKDAKHEPRTANYHSYSMVEWMTWQGIGDVVNKWRKSMDLDAIPTSEGPFLTSTLKIPHTYCWSPALVPKPADWADHINVCGFFFRDTPVYEPPADLTDFLSSGSRPIYIGFGSIVIDDPAALTSILLEAVEQSRVRAIMSRGWSKIGAPSASKNIFYLDDCPHEWLFQQVSTVVHHGGAGTAACGLRNGRPTVVVPFFGDQPFWGQMVANAKAGPEPIPYKALNKDNLADAIRYCATNEAAQAANRFAEDMRNEDGVKRAVALFHKQLPRDKMECEVMPKRAASWLYTGGKRTIRLSSTAVENLSLARDLKFKRKHLQHFGPTPISITNRRWDPVTSAGAAGFRFATDVTSSAVGLFADPVKIYLNRNEESEESGQAGQAARAVMKNVDNLTLGVIKGGVVDIPLALAEGFRNTPRLWGQSVKEQQEITGWSSGAVVAGKSVGNIFYDGVGGFFYKPYKGARDEGALGFAKGCGKGLAGLTISPVVGALGMLGYTGDGIAKSLDRAVHHKTMKRILAARNAEAKYLVEKGQKTVADEDVVECFLRLR